MSEVFISIGFMFSFISYSTYVKWFCQLNCKVTQKEGIIPALEPAHALAYVSKLAPTLPGDHLMVMNMCGRGDKDVFTVADALGVKL